MLIAEPVSRSSSLLSHRRSLLWRCAAGFGSEVMTAGVKELSLMSASRKDQFRAIQCVLSAVRLADRDFSGIE